MNAKEAKSVKITIVKKTPKQNQNCNQNKSEEKQANRTRKEGLVCSK